MKPTTPIAFLAVLAMACAVTDQERGDLESSVFETRALATDDYQGEGVSFDLEKERLQTWLAVDENRQGIAREPQSIDLYNRLGTERGGPLSSGLAWFPHKIQASSRDESRWEFSFAMHSTEDRAVPVFSRADGNDGSRPQGAEGPLIELLPINMHHTYFTQDDVDLESFRVEMDRLGQPAITYRISPERRGAYGDWTESLLNRKVAIIVNGIVLSAPVIMGRIASVGQISGVSQEEATSLVDSIRESIASRSR